jgi:hypothetical protein
MNSADPMLLLLVGNIELLAKDGHDIPRVELNLCVNGLIIVGDLISSLEFEKRSHKMMKALFGIHFEAIDETARKVKTTHTEIQGQIPEFLHLGGVEFWPHNLTEVSDAVSTKCWRVRISSIDAFRIEENFTPDA